MIHAVLASQIAPTAGAAEVTELPETRGGTLTLALGGSYLRGGLEEADIVVAERRFSRVDLGLTAEVSPFTGVFLHLGLDTTPSARFSYPDARAMVFEPTTGEGTYQFGQAGTDPVDLRSSGVNGVWLGGGVSPFNEDYERLHDGSWRLEAAVRTGNRRRNLWTGPEGQRGTSPGGTAFRLIGSFSRRSGVAEPWLRLLWQNEGPVQIDRTLEDGEVVARDLTLRPASQVLGRAGVEIIAYEQPSTERRVAVDLWAGAGYRSWEDIASGIYLPSPLAASYTIPVTAGESLHAAAGLGLDIHGHAAARGRLGLEVAWDTPYRVEHPYPVSTTADSWRIGWTFTVQGRGALPEAGPPAAE